MWKLFYGLLGLCCIGYGISIIVIAYATPFDLIWLLFGIFCLFLAYMPRFHWLKTVFLGCLMILCALMIFIYQMGQWAKPNDWQVMIVLGTKVKDGKPSQILKYRLDHAIELSQNHHQATIIVSGGHGPFETESEAKVMASYLQDHVDQSILLEDRSSDTYENLKYSLEMITKDTPVVIVSSDFHVFRAWQYAKKIGYQHVSISPSKSSNYFLIHHLLREVFAFVKFWLVR